jgi:CBS domain containing-hemolysin-like protein
MSFGQVLLIITLIALNAFFVGVEFAVISTRRSRLDLLAGPENKAANLVRKWLEEDSSRDRLIAASQLGITLVSLALGAAGENAFEAMLEPYFSRLETTANLLLLKNILHALPLVISLTVVTGFHVVLGEQVPKVAVLRNPEQFAMISAPIMHGFISVFRGFIFVLDWATRSILSIIALPSNGHTHSTIISVDELRQIVSGPEVAGVMDPPERDMLSAVIDFSEMVVRQVSVPRTEIIAIEAAAPITDAVQLAAKHGVTKLPVYEENLDQVVGILHLKDLLPALLEGGELQSLNARKLAREALFVPESISVNDLLVHMRSRRQHMAITLDEYGGTAGLVTLEDLLEEIVGEVRDPFDVDLPDVQLLPDGTALIDGMTLIEAINQHFSINLFDPNYDTIAGYILGKLGRIAQLGDVVEDEEQKIRLRVEGMDRLRIARIHLSRL